MISGKRGEWFAAFVLAAITALAYVPAMLSDGFVWDDETHILNQDLFLTWEGLWKIWFEVGATAQYYPIQHSALWIEYQFFGLDGRGYHVVNAILHILNAVVLWRLLKRLSVPYPWVVATVFALHPVHVESVAWITEVKNLLSGFFFICSSFAFVHALDVAGRARGERQTSGWYVLSVLLFLFALLSKTVTATLPASLLLFLWWKRQPLTRAVRWTLASMFALGAPIGILTVWMEKNIVGMDRLQWDPPMIERFLMAGRSIWMYVGKLLWPEKLAFVYPQWEIEPSRWVSYLLPGAMIALILGLLLASRRLGRGPVTGVLFFCGTLVPGLGFFDVYPLIFSYFFDHFQYLASIGVIALVVAVVTKIGRQWGVPRLVAGTGLVLVVGALFTLTFRQCYLYKGLESLWRGVLARYPSVWLPLNDLGDLLAGRGDTDDAIDCYRRALEVRPEPIPPLLFKTHYNLASSLMKKSEVGEAIVHFRTALEMSAVDAYAHSALGVALRMQGDVDNAMVKYRHAIAIEPDYSFAHYNLANALVSLGRFEEAIASYRRAVEIDSEYVDAHNNLGMILVQESEFKAGLDHFREAERLRPDQVEFLDNRAWVLATHPEGGREERDAAIRFARKAAELTSHQSARVLDTLALAHAALGQFDEAVETARRGIELATGEDNSDLANEIRGRLEFYVRGECVPGQLPN